MPRDDMPRDDAGDLLSASLHTWERTRAPRLFQRTRATREIFTPCFRNSTRTAPLAQQCGDARRHVMSIDPSGD
jgi:hypothetical protein